MKITLGYRHALIVAGLPAIFSSTGIAQSLNPMAPGDLAIEVPAGNSREIAYTNKEAGVFYTETNGEHRSAWQGWRVMSREILEDYSLRLGSRRIKKSEAIRAIAYPHQLVREYPGGIRETVTLADSIDAILVDLEKLPDGNVTLRPLWTDARTADDFVVSFENGVLLIAKKNHLKRSPTEDYPVWVGVDCDAPRAGIRLATGPDSAGQAFSPAGLRFRTTTSHGSFVLVAGNTKAQTIDLAKRVVAERSAIVASREKRMQAVLNRSIVRTSDSRFDKALAWARLSLDALIMNQVKKGIFAGLPWFDNYWGRDSFISLAGATLVTGDFTDAREILASFATWQDTNTTSTNYGRIPNLVTTTSIAYNTADGTPRFVIALYDYYLYTGDSAFLREMFPVVRRAVDGTMAYHTDSLSFLTHGDAETWMDAVGPDGPWSPRGNRANDIQALWYRELLTSASIARLLRPPADSLAQQWTAIAGRVKENFNRYFVDSAHEVLYDHLTADGKPDGRLRPNQLFALDLIDSNRVRESVFEAVTRQLVYPHGVASLSQEDPEFHPYHHFEPYYVQDAAYHNGIVWTWMAGEWIDRATEFGRPDLAYQVTENMVHQILDRGAVGTLSELLDAAPRPGESEPRLSGSYSQAWSLAEFVRTFYQSYLGIRVIPEEGRIRLSLSPGLPAVLSRAQAIVAIGSSNVGIDLSLGGNVDSVVLSSPGATHGIEFEYKRWRDGTASFVDTLPPNSTIAFAVEQNHLTEMRNSTILRSAILHGPSMDTSLASVALATPRVRSELKALRGPSHRLLSNAEIKRPGRDAKVLYDVADPAGDDKGTGTYTYPLTPNLKPGSLDITHFTVAADDSSAYFTLMFRKLSNPGWHPEYGFQLTYAAIAIDKDGIAGSGQVNVGMNSNWRLDPSAAFEDIIYIGGGIRIVDASGAILAEYLPVAGDEKDPLGNVAARTIQFSLPASVIGKVLASWRYTVLVGCQDDHGGAGIGEFRSVEEEAKEWIGGGKRNAGDPNVYDVIDPVPR